MQPDARALYGANARTAALKSLSTPNRARSRRGRWTVRLRSRLLRATLPLLWKLTIWTTLKMAETIKQARPAPTVGAEKSGTISGSPEPGKPKGLDVAQAAPEPEKPKRKRGRPSAATLAKRAEAEARAQQKAHDEEVATFAHLLRTSLAPINRTLAARYGDAVAYQPDELDTLCTLSGEVIVKHMPEDGGRYGEEIALGAFFVATAVPRAVAIRDANAAAQAGAHAPPPVVRPANGRPVAP